MKNTLLFLSLIFVLVTCNGQTINDTSALRTAINTDIIPASNITAAKLNRILQGFLNVLPAASATKYGTDNYLSYTIPFANTSFSDSTLVSQLDGATTSYYFSKGLWLNGNYTSSIVNSRLVAWNYGFLISGNFSQKLLFKVGDSSANLTIGIGVKGSQALGNTINQANYLTAVLGDSANSSMTNLLLAQSVVKSSGVLINKGDLVELQVNQVADSVTFFYRNLTNNNTYQLVRKVDFTTTTQYPSTIGYPTIYFAKGNVKLISYSVYKADFDYAFLGNSITAGFRTSTITGFVNQLRAYTNASINNMARSAATSTDYVTRVKDNFNFTNKTVFISGLCGNDAYTGISAATSKANYQAIVSILRANGNRIVHIDNPYRTTFLGGGGMADLTALNLWIDTTYGGIDSIVHVEAKTQANAGSWYADGTHLNAAGNTGITQMILDKLPYLFPLQNPMPGKMGISAAMSSGTVTVSNTAVTANSIILLTPIGAGSGQISRGTIVSGTSFQINSSDGSDTRKVQWWIIN